MADLIAENLRMKHALERIFECHSILKAEQIARAALQEVTPGEAADTLNVTRQTIHAYIRDGRIRSRRAGRLRLIHESELKRLLPKDTEMYEPWPQSMKTRAIMKCAEWLSYCLTVGWPKADLDELESLWWQCHDGGGNLISK